MAVSGLIWGRSTPAHIADPKPEALGLVRCVHGANEQRLPLAGRTAGWVRASLRDSLNVPYFAEALVNGTPVAQGHLLRGGDLLEFLDIDGIKGNGSESPEVLKARRLLRRYPELRLVGDEVKAMGLGPDEAIDLALASVARLMGRRFGPVPDSEVPTLQIIAETVTRIEGFERR